VNKLLALALCVPPLALAEEITLDNLCQPREEILDGSWTFPAFEPAN